MDGRSTIPVETRQAGIVIRSPQATLSIEDRLTAQEVQMTEVLRILRDQGAAISEMVASLTTEPPERQRLYPRLHEGNGRQGFASTERQAGQSSGAVPEQRHTEVRDEGDPISMDGRSTIPVETRQAGIVIRSPQATLSIEDRLTAQEVQMTEVLRILRDQGAAISEMVASLTTEPPERQRLYPRLHEGNGRQGFASTERPAGQSSGAVPEQRHTEVRDEGDQFDRPETGSAGSTR
ncbi:hypothetical protein Sjap_022862 [Stephania japonica]|uniref:Uncharacterized protein n=1 Tax=Stephania japonica TaxID=461633 RepID=A0AAP0HVB7_9MAGN